MSDFLENLIARSLSPSHVIQPRLPSLFEPLRADQALALEQGFDSESASPSSIAGEAAPPMTTFESPFAPRPFDHLRATEPPLPGVIPHREFSADQASHESMPETRPVQAERPPQTLTGESASPTVALQNVASDGPVRTQMQPLPTRKRETGDAPTSYGVFIEPESPPLAEKSAPSLSRTPDAENRRSPGQSALSDQGQAPPHSRQNVQTDALGLKIEQVAASLPPDTQKQLDALKEEIGKLHAGEAQSERRAEAEPVIRQSVVEHLAQQTLAAQPVARDESTSLQPAPQVSPRIVNVQPQIIRHIEPGATTPAQGQATFETEPTINITIGRIEVRATPSGEAPSRNQPAAPAPKLMSLQDYLRRRAKGNNR